MTAPEAVSVNFLSLWAPKSYCKELEQCAMSTGWFVLDLKEGVVSVEALYISKRLNTSFRDTQKHYEQTNER